MRTATKIDEVALFVKGNLRVFGQVVDEFLFIRFAEIVHHPERVPAAERKALDRQIAFDDPVHFRLDLAQIVLVYGRLEIYIVIKTVFYDGTDGQLAGGKYRLDRLREHVRGGVTEHVQPVLFFERNDFQRAVPVDRAGQVDQLAVHPRADRVSEQSLADALCDLSRRFAVLDFENGTVFQCDFHTVSP